MPSRILAAALSSSCKFTSIYLRPSSTLWVLQSTQDPSPFIIKILQVKFCHRSCCHDHVQHPASPSEVDAQSCQGGTDKSRSNITVLYCHRCCCNSDSTCGNTLPCQNSGFYASHKGGKCESVSPREQKSRGILTSAICVSVMVRF